MVRISFLLSIFFISTSLYSQSDVLFTVDKTPVNIDEFKYIYEKSNQNSDYSKKSLTEYLELYKNFKLKVVEAKKLGYDTSKVYLQELNGYRNQLASSYVEDKILVNRLSEEILERAKEDVSFSNIFIPAKKASSDTTEAFKKIMEAKRLVTAKNFDEIATKYSTLKNSNIGYYSAFQIPGIYTMENALYNTKVGEVSDVVRSDYGYHIIKVQDKRPSMGHTEVAHILMRKSDFISSVQAKEKILKVYDLLRDGKSFTALARQYSEDKATQQKGGYLGVVSVGKYEESFENAVIGLSKDEEYSAPFETSRGWHILKRISKKQVYSSEEEIKVLQQRVKRDSRMELAQLNIVGDTKKTDGFYLNKNLFTSYIANLTPEFLEQNWRPDYENKNNDDVLFSIGDKKVTMKEYRNYLIQNKLFRYRNKKTMTPQKVASYLYDNYEKDIILDYFTANLEKKEPAFKEIMREYEEGILLFNISKDVIWDASSKDTTGLKKFYEANLDSYKYEKRAQVQSYKLGNQDEKTLKKLEKLIVSKPSSFLIDKLSGAGLELDKKPKLIEESQFNKYYPEISFTKGDLLKRKLDNGTYEIHYVEDILPETTKPLNKIRGYVISDYQEQLEKDWLKSLYGKYSVTENTAVLKKLVK